MTPSHLRDFSGGLNLRDAASELAGNESPDLWNVTLDEHGGAGSRLGYVKLNNVAYNASPVKNDFYWATQLLLITQSGTGLYRHDTGALFKTFTTSDRCAMADFAGKLCITHPVDGFFTYDGAAVVAVAAGPKGNTMAPWQNKLWVGGPPNGARVTWSALGDPTTWNVADFNDLRDKDNTSVTCVVGASDQDIIGRFGLVVCKSRSTYRIYDSTTGAYQTIDPTVGAASALAVTRLLGRVYAISDQGIFSTDGVSAMKPVGDNLRPLWDVSQLNISQADLMCAGSFGERCYFSLPRAGSTVNNLALEFHPKEGWITANSNAASCYSRHGVLGELFVFGSPTVNGQVYQAFSGGTDDGVAIASRFQTPWLPLANDLKASLRKVRVNGRGTFTLSVYRDYTTAAPVTRSVAITPTNGVGAFAPDLYTLGVGRVFSFRFDASTSTVFTAPALLGGATPSVGAVALYGLDLYPIPLARM